MEYHANNDYEKATVLVTAKTYPNVSSQYTELVCTAGIRIDTHPARWIRLYPVPFRLLDEKAQYKKWEIIEAAIVKRDSDRRPESFQPKKDSIKPTGKVINTGKYWKARCGYLKPFLGETTACRLLRDARKRGTRAPSLGLIHPRKVLDHKLEYNPAYQEALSKKEETEILTLFGTESRRVFPAPFKLKYTYLCEDPGCRSHSQSLLDWEMGGSAVRSLREHGMQYAQNVLEHQFITNPMSKDLWFFLGNVHKRPQDFMILGLFYPPLGIIDSLGAGLFA